MIINKKIFAQLKISECDKKKLMQGLQKMILR